MSVPSALSRTGLVAWGLLLAGLPLPAQETLPAMVISASRAPAPPAEIPFSVTVLSGEALRAIPAATVDDALRSVPGFSLFRRSDSLTANPTTQGVSLRGLGPNGASRSLILLDGVPLNDPFGGWVAWAKVPRETLVGAELVRGGGATAWGNAALGGVVQLLTEGPPSNPIGYLGSGPPNGTTAAPQAPSNLLGYLGRRTAGRLAVTGGDFGLRSAEFAATASAGRGSLQISGNDFAFDGFPLVAPEDRGPIDTEAWSRHHWLAARWNEAVGANGVLTVSARIFAEARGNGTPYQRNSSWENFGSVAFTTQPAENFSWSSVVYAQDQSFASTFSSVNAARTGETPASNQFAVPATALGAAWTGVWQGANDSRTSAGLDYRRVRGESREYFSYAGGDFTRERIAGGAQDFTGLFALHERPLGADWRATAGARLDFWRERDGHRLETVRATGAVLRDETYPDRDGVEFSPSAGLVWRPATAWRLHAAVQHSFRRPTLNELYRPFRVGNVITEANAALKTERALNGELGADYTRGPLVMSAAVFRNDLHDAVTNITLAHGPGTFPVVGFIPAGGVGRQRLNLDRLRVQGVELSANWQAAPALSFSADFLYDDTAVLRASRAPALVGKQLAQVPRQSASFGASWRPVRKLTVTPRVRALGRQYEDDENLLRLGAALVVDLGVSYRVGPVCEIFLRCENLTGERVETGRSADGIVNTGAPRFVQGGLRCTW